jgi:hypothetical protein
MYRGADLLYPVVEGHARSLNLELWLRRGGTGQVGRDTITEGTKTVEDVDLCTHVVPWSFRNSLEHWISERGENIVDLGKEEREEAVVAVAKDGEESHELVKIIAGTESERLGVCG